MADKDRGRGKPERAYTSLAIKAAGHPTRQRILKRLQQGEASTVELEQETGENRYNLYHHLSVLEDAGLVEGAVREGKTKVYEAVQVHRPETAVILATREEEPEKLEQLLDALAGVLGHPLPHAEKIQTATLMLSYDWTPDKKD